MNNMSKGTPTLIITVCIVACAGLAAFFLTQDTLENEIASTPNDYVVGVNENNLDELESRSEEPVYQKKDTGKTAEDLLPPDAEIVDRFSLEMNGDDIPEEVFVFYSKLHEKTDGIILYINVMHKGVDGLYTRIKEDKVRTDIGFDSGFAQINAVDMGDREALFVYKVLESRRMYYVYGFVDGEFEDFAISRAYLHPEKYITEKHTADKYTIGGDTCNLELLGVTQFMKSEELTRLRENYEIVCGSEDRRGVVDSFYVDQNVTPDGTLVVSKPVYHERPNPVTSDFQIQRTTSNEYGPREILYQGNVVVTADEFDRIYIGDDERDLEYLERYVWRVFEGEDTIDVYLAAVGGCGGCTALKPQYISIDKKTSDVVVNEYGESEGMFNTRCVAHSAYSPDRKKMVCYFHTKVLLFDFEEKKETVLYTSPEGYAVGRLGCMGCVGDGMYWMDNDTFVIQEYKIDTVEGDFPFDGFEYYKYPNNVFFINTT